MVLKNSYTIQQKITFNENVKQIYDFGHNFDFD